MSNVNSTRMKEREDTELEKYIKAHIKEVDQPPFHINDDCPFLVRKLEEAYKTFEEAPLPDFLLKRMEEEK